ncbi:MAG: hypothetical protein ACTHMM_18325 [Agriterribacter sp.]
MKKGKQSLALDIMDNIYCAANIKGYSSFNSALQNQLRILINLSFEFDKNDYSEILRRYNGGYWLGVSCNSHHLGDSFYTAGTFALNNSFCHSYEFCTGRTPFLIGGKRMYTGFDFYYKGLRCKITGWDKSNTKITAIGYKNTLKKLGRKLFSFDRDQWLEARKEIKTTL